MILQGLEGLTLGLRPSSVKKPVLKNLDKDTADSISMPIRISYIMDERSAVAENQELDKEQPK
jgi:hypothetical protein